MINIIYGSIFDFKCDLIIIPCDNAINSSEQNKALKLLIDKIAYDRKYNDLRLDFIYK